MSAGGTIQPTLGTSPSDAEASAPADPARRHRRWRSLALRSRATVLPVLLVVAVLGAWQLSAEFNWINPLYTSSPWAIIVDAYHLLPSSEGRTDMATSGEEFAIGLALSMVAGIVLGLLLGWYKWLEETTSLALNMFYSMPLIALGPVFVLWFGIGLESKVAIVFLSSLFPQMISTMSGVKQVDRSLLDVSRSYGATRLQLWRTVVLPAAVPSIVTGIRLGMVAALIGTVVGEFIASSAGLGYLIATAGSNFDITDMFVGLLVIVVVAALLSGVLRTVERRLANWRS